MSMTTEHTETETPLTEVKEQTKRGLLEGLKTFARRFWAHTEATGEMNTKPFDGWQ